MTRASRVVAAQWRPEQFRCCPERRERHPIKTHGSQGFESRRPHRSGIDLDCLIGFLVVADGKLLGQGLNDLAKLIVGQKGGTSTAEMDGFDAMAVSEERRLVGDVSHQSLEISFNLCGLCGEILLQAQ